jgi:undecaprenyl-diphosphatase
VNYRLFNDIHGLAGNSAVDAIMKFSAKYLLYVLVVVLGLLLLQRWRETGFALAFRTGLWCAAGLVLSFVLGLGAAAAHKEARPFTTHPSVHPLIAHDAGQSFPSDHTTAAFAIALVILFFLSRSVGVVVLLAAALIGFARVYIGVHYPGDILASVVVALVGVGIVAGVHSRSERSRPRSGALAGPNGLRP